MSFANKVVLITGAAGGIGKETVKAFASEGAKLALVDLNRDALQQTAQDLELKEGNYLLLPANVAKEEQVQDYVQKTKDTFGRIDVFFNNAGVEGAISLITDYPTEALNTVIDVNFKGAFWGLKYVLRVMAEQKSGSIVNMASIAGLKGMPYTSVYVATKHAVVGFTKSAAIEYATSGIRVNAVCPAMVNTRMMESIEQGISPDNPNAAKDELLKGLPMGRYSEPREIADVVLFLASDKASFLNGIAMPIDSGMIA